MYAVSVPPPEMPTQPMRLASTSLQRGQIVDAAHAVPDAIAGQAAAEQIQRVAKHRMFAAAEVEARFPLFRIPELAAFPLADRIVGQHDVAALRQVDVQGLIRRRRLAVVGMAARAEDAGPGRRNLLRPVQERRHKVAREALIRQLLDDVIAGVDAACLLDRRRAGFLGQSAQEPKEGFPQRLLQCLQVGPGADGREAGTAPLLLPGGQFEDLLMDGGTLFSGGRQASGGGEGQGEEFTTGERVHGGPPVGAGGGHLSQVAGFILPDGSDDPSAGARSSGASEMRCAPVLAPAHVGHDPELRRGFYTRPRSTATNGLHCNPPSTALQRIFGGRCSGE